MRNLTVPLVLLLIVAACGGSQVSAAKTARYQGDKQALFVAVKTATEAKYQVAQTDEATLTLQTTARWFTPEGLASSASDENINELPDKSIKLSFVVKLVPDADKWRVEVAPVMLRYNKGTPMPEKIASGDASLPGWTGGKVDQLLIDLHGALGQYEVKEVVQPMESGGGGGVDPGPSPSGW
jgi:hypothetical protein